MDIIKNFTSISAIAAFIFAVTYFIIRLPVYEYSNINKTEFNKDTVKGLTIVVIVCFILFSLATMFFNNKVKMVHYRSYIKLCSGYIIVYLYFFCRVEYKRKSIVNAANSYIKDEFLYKIYEAFSIVLIFIAAFIMAREIYNYYIMNNCVIYKLSFWMNEKIPSNVVFLIECVFLYLITMPASSYILAYSQLFNFKKYLIFSEKFSDKKIMGYVLFENDDEIMVKCDESYPIILKKADIDNYMEIPDSALMGEDKKIHINTKYNGIYRDEFTVGEPKVNKKSLFSPYVFSIIEIVIFGILIIFFGWCIYSSDNSSKFHSMIKCGIVIMIITRVIFFEPILSHIKSFINASLKSVIKRLKS